MNANLATCMRGRAWNERNRVWVWEGWSTIVSFRICNNRSRSVVRVLHIPPRIEFTLTRKIKSIGGRLVTILEGMNMQSPSQPTS